MVIDNIDIKLNIYNITMYQVKIKKKLLLIKSIKID